MKYKELFTATDGVANIFASARPDDFAAIFGDTTANSLDVYGLVTWGERSINPAITEENKNDVIGVIISMNVDGWKKQAAAMQAEYEATNPTTKVTEHTSTGESTETGTDNSINSNKVFDDEQFNEHGREQSDQTKNKQESGSYTNTEKGIGNNHLVSEAIQKEIALRRLNWKKDIIFAVVKEITLSIYE